MRHSPVVGRRNALLPKTQPFVVYAAKSRYNRFAKPMASVARDVSKMFSAATAALTTENIVLAAGVKNSFASLASPECRMIGAVGEDNCCSIECTVRAHMHVKDTTTIVVPTRRASTSNHIGHGAQPTKVHVIRV